MAMQDLPPVPHKAPMIDEGGIPTPIWSDWFKKLFTRVGGHLGNSDDWATSKAGSGYQRLPSGLVIQWGMTAILSSGSAGTIAFPMAFEAACLQGRRPGGDGNLKESLPEWG